MPSVRTKRSTQEQRCASCLCCAAKKTIPTLCIRPWHTRCAFNELGYSVFVWRLSLILGNLARYDNSQGREEVLRSKRISESLRSMRAIVDPCERTECVAELSDHPSSLLASTSIAAHRILLLFVGDGFSCICIKWSDTRLESWMSILLPLLFPNFAHLLLAISSKILCSIYIYYKNGTHI